MFSQPPAIPGAYGPQGMHKSRFAGKAMFTYRYSYRPAVWEHLLTRAGFATAKAEVLEVPKPSHIGTRIVSARAEPCAQAPAGRRPIHCSSTLDGGLVPDGRPHGPLHGLTAWQRAAVDFARQDLQRARREHLATMDAASLILLVERLHGRLHGLLDEITEQDCERS